MPRPLRVEFAGAIYHLMSRGDHREAIFRDDEDRQTFLRTLGEACEKTGWQVHAYCLMGNHFHLVTEPPQPNLVAGMKWFLHQIVRQGLQAVGWSEAELDRHPKGHPHKAALALRLRRETPMTRAWIARRLRIGSASYVSYLLAKPRSRSEDGLMPRR
jgi:REP element-mobilizing transposase RayT